MLTFFLSVGPTNLADGRLISLFKPHIVILCVLCNYFVSWHQSTIPTITDNFSRVVRLQRIYSVSQMLHKWMESLFRVCKNLLPVTSLTRNLSMCQWQSSFKYIDINYIVPSPPPLQLLGYQCLKRGYHSSIRYCRFRVAMETIMAKRVMLIGNGISIGTTLATLVDLRQYIRKTRKCLVMLICLNFKNKENKLNKWDILLILDLNFIW